MLLFTDLYDLYNGFYAHDNRQMNRLYNRNDITHHLWNIAYLGPGDL